MPATYYLIDLASIPEAFHSNVDEEVAEAFALLVQKRASEDKAYKNIIPYVAREGDKTRDEIEGQYIARLRFAQQIPFSKEVLHGQDVQAALSNGAATLRRYAQNP